MPRLRDIEAQLVAIKAAEASLDSAQLDIIREIIYLRRGIESDVHIPRFRSLLDEGGEAVLSSFSTRWLVSVADTFVDHGNPNERACAMIIVVLANVVRLAETERLYLRDSTIDEKRREQFVMPGTPLWDGMVSYAIRHGDTPLNMWTRIRVLMADSPTLRFVFETVLGRMVGHDTLLGRLAKLNLNFHQLVEPLPYWEIVD